uniref:GAF domain-containing protein n=1 Tax=Phytophthora ramorum TaxID=164328 RepID=H3GU74_PHYRM
MPASRSDSPERGEATADESDQDARIVNNRSQFSAPSSFFIIHESTSSIILPNGGTRSPPKLRRKGDEGGTPSNRARHGGSSSSSSRKKKSSSKTPSSATLRKSPSPIVDEEDEDLVRPQSDAETLNAQATAKKERAMELSILNRCGSAPDLPMYSPLSASVYSSSKKRTFQSTSGASPHLATLQRSRLTPLPVKTRSDVAMPDPLLENIDTLEASGELGTLSLSSKDPLLQEKMRYDAQTIASLKQRLVLLEREISSSTKYRHATEKQIAQLSRENQRLQAEKTQQQARTDELDKTVLRQRHEYDKLAARYASVYANLQKLVDQPNASDNSAQQSALQALARENQDFLRKLRVLEARHAEDKTLTSNQDKKIKRLKAEIEALQHMRDAKNREDELDDSASDIDQISRLGKQKKRPDSDSNYGGRPNSASSTVSITSSTPRRVGSSARVQTVQTSALGSSSHLVTAEAYQYIDPNILKVLEKVDSQFSITNAINLSVVLKKWLNSCVHIVCSTHLPTVLQTLLKRTYHATRKLVALCSERGMERWELPLDKGIAGYAARHNTLCNVHCANDDPRFYSSTDSVTGTISREVLALPIVHELQLYLEAHLVNGAGSNHTKTNSLGVFAVLRAWNTTHQKPFSANDQVLGSLLAIQAGIIVRQSAVTKTLQKVNHKTHQILQMPDEIVAKASTASHLHTPGSEIMQSEFPGASRIPSVVQLVAAAQKELGECLDIKQIRIFVLDAAVQKLWHVGEQMSTDGTTSSAVRRYVSAQASLCALLLRSDATPMVLTEPSSDASFNDTVDIAGGARGLYLVPILSPWGNEALPFGVLQVARVAKARLSASPFALTASEGTGNGSAADIAVTSEREAAQQTEDRLMLELLGLFSRVFAGLLHHVAGQQLYDTCPPEILQTQLATLSDHLDSLAARRKLEDENEDVDDMLSSSSNSLPPEVASLQQLEHLTKSPRPELSDDVSGSMAMNTADERAGVNTILEPGPEEYEQLATEQGQQVEVDTTQALWTLPDDTMTAHTNVDAPPLPGDWSSAYDVNAYATALDGEQFVDEGSVAYNGEEGDQYDPMIWSAEGEPGAYEAGALWEYMYSTVEDAALADEDEDGTSKNREASHLSTNSAYAIDLQLSSRNTPSAESDEPSGAL